MKWFVMAAVVMLAGSLSGTGVPPVKHVLFSSKAASWEKKIVRREDGNLSLVEKAVAWARSGPGHDKKQSKKGFHEMTSVSRPRGKMGRLENPKKSRENSMAGEKLVAISKTAFILAKLTIYANLRFFQAPFILP